MKYLVTVKGDQNDADYVEASYTYDFDELAFSDWGEDFKNIPVTWREVFQAFGDSLKSYKSTSSYSHHNWDNGAWESVLGNVVILLGLEGKGVTASEVHELIWECIPGSCDYPVHTIYSVTATPVAGSITFY